MYKLLVGLLLCSALGFAQDKWDHYIKETLVHQKNIPGWCSLEKAEKLMRTVYEAKPSVCVEIGVFGGSSIYPIASALKYLDSGVVYCIDPWSKVESIENYKGDDLNYDWWSKIDYEGIYSGFVQMLSRFHLLKYAQILRMTSGEAAHLFKDESIDILHIDGNHSEVSSMRDVLLYLPKLKQGGLLWFDDADWSTTQKTVQYLKENMEWDEAGSCANQCLLFIK